MIEAITAMMQHFCNEVQVFLSVMWSKVIRLFPSPLWSAPCCQVDSNQGLKKGLGNIAMTLSKIQAFQVSGSSSQLASANINQHLVSSCRVAGTRANMIPAWSVSFS